MGNEHYKNLSLASVVGEEWKDIKDFEGYYQVSNMGRVKSLEREVWNGKSYYTLRERIRKQCMANSGSLGVTLKRKNGDASKSVPSLVAKVFKDNQHNYPFVFHKNSNSLDNRVSNLYFGDVDTLANVGSKGKKHSSSKYQGVAVSRSLWSMNICINGKGIRKYFKTELEAAKKYDYYVKLHKLNRELNFPDEK